MPVFNCISFLRIAFLSTFEKHGGAGLAAYRLRLALQKHFSAEIICFSQFEGDFRKFTLKNIPALARIGFDKYFLKKQLRKRSDLYKFETGRLGLPLHKNPDIVSSDIIHLHWIQQGFLSLEEILKLSRIKPVIWTLHDMWPFTGGCCYSNECTRYMDSCGSCPYLKNPDANDLSSEIWKKKERIYQGGKITLVGPSQWICRKAAESSLGRMADIRHIPYAIDTDLFTPVERERVRLQTGIREDEFVLLFGAQNLDDERKGFRILEEALILVKQSGFSMERMRLFVFGATSRNDNFHSLPVRVNYAGTIKSPEELKKLYQVSDWYVHAALADNLPNTVIESVACGTPVMGFDSGGILEIITDGFNGMIAKHMTAEDLAQMILRSFDARGLLSELRKNARHFALENYSMEKISKAYADLYREVSDQ